MEYTQEIEIFLSGKIYTSSREISFRKCVSRVTCVSRRARKGNRGRKNAPRRIRACERDTHYFYRTNWLAPATPEIRSLVRCRLVDNFTQTSSSTTQLYSTLPKSKNSHTIIRIDFATGSVAGLTRARTLTRFPSCDFSVNRKVWVRES